MNTIKFNNVTIEVEGYNKNTYLNGNTITSNASCSVRTNDMTTLNELMQTPIEAIQIYHNDTLIYDLDDIDARIESINEYLNEDHMNINVNLAFLNDSESESEPEVNEGV